MGRLDGKVAIVTGAALGIGPYYARGLAAEGAKVAIIDVEPADKIVAEIKQAGGTAMSMVGDVSDSAAVKKFTAAVENAYGGIHILINNASLARMGRQTVTELGVEEWDRYFAVNVRGMFLCVQAVVPIMKRQNYGKIVNITSGTVWSGPPMMLHYVSTKGAILGMTRALATELGKDGIRVNAIAPGLTSTEYIGGRNDYVDYRQAMANTRAIKREEMPEDLVGTCLFFASPDSDFVTGQCLVVDGGALKH
ncbi:MAG TPA: SDR family oxidoreductase [Stellaceae bacterium]|jgi:NAD(P)-dependent dehydrogenase (short-subunit alcohol dehydrogenase family)|nr:SDR family oxidoreductase [Stellaceae bacterium]